jgi:hypothetical protein
VGAAGQPLVPVLLVVALAVVAFCAPMLVVVLSRGNVRSTPRRRTSPRAERNARVARRVQQQAEPAVRAQRPPLPRRERRPRGHEPEMAGTVLHAVHPAQDAELVVAELTRAGFATVVDPENPGLILVESPADADQHEQVRQILSRRVA